MIREWLDNAFWENNNKDKVTGILKIVDDEDRVTTQVQTITKPQPGDNNPDWDEIMEQLGPDKIDASTAQRLEKKEQEAQQERTRQQDLEQARKLEKLFNAKLQAFEIDYVKNSTNRFLKTKLRRAKTLVEVNVYAMMIAMECIENEKNEE